MEYDCGWLYGTINLMRGMANHPDADHQLIASFWTWAALDLDIFQGCSGSDAGSGL